MSERILEAMTINQLYTKLDELENLEANVETLFDIEYQIHKITDEIMRRG